ncbi:hypothetical protein ROTO_27200 [Roseovarius tolerans]|uniref:DUF1330 domain-containing protein n=1 Tax=Roseovarius tolerans TaxID=74031 RepID=A0A0L6CSR6_9RHOB|nr:DUF1330 domain-containing protein [Roseovarius tolerans]KNX40715.1 hypothetical protein ROTO_27200 [Roseovarius tolerans]
MPAYLIAQVKITDDAWVADYAACTHEIAAKHGGRYLLRSANIETIEGAAPDTTLIALIEFPSADAARAFAEDAEYAPLAQARQAGSEGHFWVIDDTDVAGSIPYLPKG